MIQPQVGVSFPGMAQIVPEGVGGVIGMPGGNGIGPALLEQPLIGFADLRQEQRVVTPAVGVIDIAFGGDDVEVARQDHRDFQTKKLPGMGRELFQPGQLVVQPRSRCRVAVRGIKAADQQAADRRLDIAALGGIGILRQTAPGQHRRADPRQDRHTVPAALPMPDGRVSGLCQVLLRKPGLWRLQFLEADDVGPGFGQPGQQRVQAAVDAVDVVGGDLQNTALPVKATGPAPRRARLAAGPSAHYRPAVVAARGPRASPPSSMSRSRPRLSGSPAWPWGGSA